MRSEGNVDGIEWPTVAVAAVIATGTGLALAGRSRLPVGVQAGALAVLAAWYNSLQHEVIHGHPTPWRGLNRALAALPLGLVTPLATYRQTHLAHHLSGDRLTDPTVDPESFQVTAAQWASAGVIRRSLWQCRQTLAGRLVLGPLWGAARTWSQLRRIHGPDAGRVVAGHLAGVAAVLAVVWASGTSVLVYAAATVWAGGALSLLRSFAEHRPAAAGSRSAMVRAGWFFSLLYLNNNLHHTHHAAPRAPWYALPELSVDLGSDAAARSGAGWYRGYGSILWHHALRPIAPPVAPSIS